MSNGNISDIRGKPVAQIREAKNVTLMALNLGNNQFLQLIRPIIDGNE